MFGTDMCGKKRFYVKGKKTDAERFTIDLTWYHSALASFGSTNELEGEIVLNLIVKDDADDIEEERLRNMAKKFNCVGFTSFTEI